MRNLNKEINTSGLVPSRNGIGDFFPHEPTIFAQQSGGTKFTVNITDDFDRPHTFDQVVALLSTATEEDEIVFNINSAGGYVDSLNMLLGWKALCKARQVHVLMGNASSAASAFFLSKADQYIVGEGATMMIHEFQSGVYGTQSNNDRRNSHSSAECRKFVQNTYAAFLSQEEIEDVLKGVEIYLDSEQISKRLEVRLRMIQSKQASELSIEDELKIFEGYLKTLSPDEIQAELDEMGQFLKLALEAKGKLESLKDDEVQP